MQDLYALIDADPRFHELEARRARLAWSLSVVVLAAYFGFVLAVAFAPGWLAQPLGPESPVSRGIPLGIGVIVLSVVLTGLYVRHANLHFDPITRRVLEAARQQAGAPAPLDAMEQAEGSGARR